MSQFSTPAPLEPKNDEAGVIDGGTAVGSPKPPPWWKEDGAPEGAHENSLFTTDANGAKHFAGPTHYHHLADGRVVAGYGGGTHYAEGDKLMPIVGVYEG